MSLQAYQRTAQRTEGPRETEYRLFGEVTRALIDAQAADVTDFKTRVGALDWNRRLWSALAIDCSQPENRLPEALRARIISLSIWVSRHTSEVVRDKGDYEALIEVNRIVMQGLAQQGAQAA